MKIKNWNDLLSFDAIRHQCQKIFELTIDDQGLFIFHEERYFLMLHELEKFVKKNHSDIAKIPSHSRWNHFRMGNIPRDSFLDEITDKKELFLSKCDLTMLSVLMDAGAGAQWSYEWGGKRFRRSEGLALACLEGFRLGMFSGDGSYSVTYKGLNNLTIEDFKEIFQISPKNNLYGFEGRFEILKKWKKIIGKNHGEDGRPSDILHNVFLYSSASMRNLLATIVTQWSELWKTPSSLQGPWGDIWHHPALGSPKDAESYIPFYKLVQWLLFSLEDPLREADVEIFHLEEMTALAEYRNGGIFIDSGVLSLKNKEDYKKTFFLSDPLMIEWRALTIKLIDMMLVHIHHYWDIEKDWTMGQLLEAGTWNFGRMLALKRDKSASSPLNVETGGTLF